MADFFFSIPSNRYLVVLTRRRHAPAKLGADMVLFVPPSPALVGIEPNPGPKKEHGGRSVETMAELACAAVRLSELHSVRTRVIADGIGVSERTVRRWLSLFQGARVASECVFEGHHGRPSVLGKAEEKAVKGVFRAVDEPTRSDVQQAVHEATGLEIGLCTAAKAIKGIGRRYLAKLREPELSPVQIKRRLQFAAAHRHQDWTMALFSDEKTFEAGHQQRKAWQRPKHRMVIRRSGHPPKVHVFAAVGHFFRSEPVFFNGTLDKDKLCKILRKQLPPTASADCPNESLGGWILVHDNDPKFTSHKAQALLDSLAPDRIRDWPANSPDLNPIENVWSQLQLVVNRKKPKNVKQLKRAIRRAWSNLDFKQIRKLTSSMPARFKALRAAHGGGTGY